MLACRSCQFSGMNPVEVATRRTELAIAEASYLEAQVHVQRARAELDGLIKEIQAGAVTPAIEAPEQPSRELEA